MKSKLIFTFIGVMLSITLASVADEGANPFNPIFSSTLGGATDAPTGTEGKHPLQQYPVKNYILMGVIASGNANIALIRARNGEEYFVRVGNLLGNAEGKITEINGVGIEVSEKDRVVSLMVRNRSMNNEKTE
jgi:type IV pilus assembly protein PilP